MNILFFRGGMGNQLFQYAYYQFLLKKGFSSIKLDSFAPSMRKRYGFQLRTIFPSIAADKNFLPYLLARPSYLLFDTLNKLFKINLFTNGGNTNNPVIPRNKVWIRGLWQEYAFLDSMRDDLLSIFRFIPFKKEEVENINIVSDIESSESVSLHIRRGNYLNPKQRIYFADICTLDYYKEAIDKIKELVPNAKFFIFSNDQEWVKQQFNLPNAVFVEWNTGNQSFRDMQLMSLCKHNIIANSTFSWWAAWLNKNEKKIVITPRKWQHNADADAYDKLIPSSWLKVGPWRPFVSLIVSDALTKDEANLILCQQYKDVELIIQEESIGATPKGIHILPLKKADIPSFKDKKHLQKRLISYFSTMKDK